MRITSDTAIIAGAIAAGLLLAWYSRRAVADAAQAVNPLNNDNIINRAAQAITGNDNKTSSIGSKIHEWFNPGFANYNPNAPVKPAATVASRVQ